MCSCPQKYFVKLGDFDSSTTVPGFGLKIEPHQMIRYASVLPLGTMGYRAPEVSIHHCTCCMGPDLCKLSVAIHGLPLVSSLSMA